MRRLVLSPFIIVTVLGWVILSFLAACATERSPVDEEPQIFFEFHGYRDSPVFSLRVLGRGEVTFIGIKGTRVLGETKTRVSEEKARGWIRLLVERGALEARERPAFAPFIHSDWARLTIVADGKRNSYRFDGWNRAQPRIQALGTMIRDLDVFKKWVNERDQNRSL